MKRLLLLVSMFLLPAMAHADLHNPSAGTVALTSTQTWTAAQTFSSATITNPRLVGTTTNDNAAVGNYGEYISSYGAVTNAPGTGNYGDLASVSLSTGDWDVTLVQSGNFNGAVITNMFIGVGTIAGNNNPNITNQGGDDQVNIPFSSTVITTPSGSLPNVRVLLAATTTIYYKILATYSAGTPQFKGRISARRMR